MNILKRTIVLFTGLIWLIHPAIGQSLENLNRGLVAVNVEDGNFVSWRLLGNEPNDLQFNLYRVTGGSGEMLNETPLTASTNYLDSAGNVEDQYFVKPVIDGQEQASSDTVDVWSSNYLNVPLQRPSGGTTPDGVSFTYEPNDASVGDLDGDEEYEIVLKWNPTNAKDNSQSGHTGNVIIDAYELDGTHLWRIDMGVNIRAGAHYTQFMVYDLTGDGKAEISMRTAPGTKDATGSYLSMGPAAGADHTVDYRNSGGYILEGPEYLTVFNGEDGTEKFTMDFEPNRGSASDWGDNYGNRVDRFLGAIAYLDGNKPSLIWGRGIYTKVEIVAYDWEGEGLTEKWFFKSQEGYNDYYGMGSHNLSVGDADGDGKDEIIYGNCAIDDDGTGLWTIRNSIGQGTGDAMHFADIIPEREGMEKFGITEGEGTPGAYLCDAATGEILWQTGPADVGRGVSADLSPDSFGMECWGGTDGLRSGYNVRVGNNPSSTNHVVWWDGDLSRELLNSNHISKYGGGTLLQATGCSSNNGSKSNPCLQADLFGDWREEVIWRTNDNSNLRIYTTTAITPYRIKTLMHDRMYRLGIAWQNNSYNQPPHTSFFLGTGMFTPLSEIPPGKPTGFNIESSAEFIRLTWSENLEPDLAGYQIHRSVAGGAFSLMDDVLVTAVQFDDTDIQLEVEYRYFISAVDTLGNASVASDTLLEIPTNRPNPPESIYGSGGFEKALVFWDVPTGNDIAGYNVYYRLATDNDFVKANAEVLSTPEFIHESITNNTEYVYEVTSLNSDPLESFHSPEITVMTGEKQPIQAEDAASENVFIESNHLGFNGTGFTNFDAVGFVEFKNVYSRVGGLNELIIRYALGNSGRTGTLTVNDSTFAYTMAGTGAWDAWVTDTVAVYLNPEFDNTIRFDATGGDFGNLDEIRIGDETEIVEPPIDPPLSVLENEVRFSVYPNPFKNNVTITLIGQYNKVPRLEVVNLVGQKVMADKLERLGENRFEYVWNGSNKKGNRLPGGVYLITVISDNDVRLTSRTMLIN